jgi:RNA polymerase sigma-70 factor (ECF subfamily)
VANNPILSEREFTEEIEKCRRIIFKVIRLYVNNPEDEKDLYQEILLQAWRSYTRFRGESKFSTWLYRISLNTVLTFKRRPYLVKPHEDLASLNTPVPNTRPADEVDALYSAIKSLNEIDRMIITLHLDGYANEEIADIAGLTAGHIGVKLFRIKALLTNILN